MIDISAAGVYIVLGQDIEPSCVQTIIANGHKAVDGDVRSIDAATLLQIAGLVAGEPFLVCGEPPCQPFSTAGKRLGVNDPRGSLFMDFVRMIDEMRPRFFVMENVKGLLSAKLKDADGNSTDTNVMEIVLDAFNKLRYKTTYGLLDAVNYGVPQFRERFVMNCLSDMFVVYPVWFNFILSLFYGGYLCAQVAGFVHPIFLPPPALGIAMGIPAFFRRLLRPDLFQCLER